MTAQVDYDTVPVGMQLAPREFQLLPVNEIMYCGATLDFAGVHWNPRVARSVGMDHIVAHGPLTEAKALSLIHEWTGDPGTVVAQHARFHRPVLIPDDGEGARYRIHGTVTEKLADRRVVVELTAVSPEEEELVTVRAVVQLV
ncbi:MaoC/PaaZ C-terminal domain-containing protein [Streptomyces inhibens]|uniref:MaoC/PaaZ C-terminal domain-containing protein n=1 Tax=Streptomyces inhibens TaxID=2293571 RepID=UPI00402AC09C